VSSCFLRRFARQSFFLPEEVLLLGIVLKLCPRLIELHKDQLGQVLVVGAHVLVRMDGQTSLAVHLLDVRGANQLTHIALLPSSARPDNLVEGREEGPDVALLALLPVVDKHLLWVHSLGHLGLLHGPDALVGGAAVAGSRIEAAQQLVKGTFRHLWLDSSGWVSRGRSLRWRLEEAAAIVGSHRGRGYLGSWSVGYSTVSPHKISVASWQQRHAAKVVVVAVVTAVRLSGAKHVEIPEQIV